MQLSLIAMSDNCMEFMYLQPHVQMPDDDTSTRQAIIATICLTGFLYIMCRLCNQNQRLHYLPYMRSHLFTADAGSAYIGKERKWTCIVPIVINLTTKRSDVDHTELPANTPHLPFLCISIR